MARHAVDETTPLLVEAGQESRQLPEQESPDGINFHPQGDPENPLEWSVYLKWGVVTILASTALSVTFNCTSIVPVARSIVDELRDGEGADTPFAAVLPITIWELGEAVGPLLIGPLSEIFGRYPLVNAANILLLMGTAASALSPNMPVFLISRALTGMAVASNVLSPAIIGDIFVPEQRGTAMSMVTFAPIVGGTIGPAVGGFVGGFLGWRSVIWVSMGLAGVCGLLSLTLFRETYKVKILRSRAARLRKEAGNPPSDPDSEKRPDNLMISMLRPFGVLMCSGVLVALSLFGAFHYSQVYVLSTTLPVILEDVYGLSQAEIGSAFLVNGLGSTIGVVICRQYLDRTYIKLSTANNGVGHPEHRLPLSIAAGFCMPPALMLCGWCAELKLPLALLLLCLVWLRVCLVLCMVPVMSYIVDACGIYAASALTGVITIRCLAGVFFPLATAHLIDSVGYGWGYTSLGLLGLAVAVIPALVLRYGSYWRQHSKYTRTT